MLSLLVLGFHTELPSGSFRFETDESHNHLSKWARSPFAFAKLAKYRILFGRRNVARFVHAMLLEGTLAFTSWRSRAAVPERRCNAEAYSICVVFDSFPAANIVAVGCDDML